MTVFRPFFRTYLRDLLSKQRLQYAKRCAISMQFQACKAFKHVTNGSGDNRQKREKKSENGRVLADFFQISPRPYIQTATTVCQKMRNFNASLGL